MIQKRFENTRKAVADIHDGATLLVGGFGGSGLPSHLIAALVEQGAKDLTVVSNNIGAVSDGVAALISNNQVKKIICSFVLQH
jgi:3-oxoadipate CoA-transferase, alpha subunit